MPEIENVRPIAKGLEYRIDLTIECITTAQKDLRINITLNRYT